MRILEEFWYGNIEPTEYDTSSKEYKKLLEPICRNEEKLKATMTGEQKELFDKYADCVREYQTITDCFIGPHPKAFSFFVKIRHRAPLTSYTEKKGVGTCCGRKEEK